MRRAPQPILFAFLLLAAATGVFASEESPAGRPGFRLLEATAASVDGEIIFYTDVLREACFARCGVFPGELADNVPLSEARKKLVANTLILQEQRKLLLGGVDNALLARVLERFEEKLRGCADACASKRTKEELAAAVADRLLVQDFLERRVTVLIEVTEEEVQREVRRRSQPSGHVFGSISEDEIRALLLKEKSAFEIRNWFTRAAGNARIFLSPMEEK